MITDEQMISLGFEKKKNYRKRKVGVSNRSWYHEYYLLELSLEKDLGSDFGDKYFMPTFRFGNNVRCLKDIEKVKELLKFLNIDYNE